MPGSEWLTGATPDRPTLTPGAACPGTAPSGSRWRHPGRSSHGPSCGRGCSRGTPERVVASPPLSRMVDVRWVCTGRPSFGTTSFDGPAADRQFAPRSDPLRATTPKRSSHLDLQWQERAERRCTGVPSAIEAGCHALHTAVPPSRSRSTLLPHIQAGSSSADVRVSSCRHPRNSPSTGTGGVPSSMTLDKRRSAVLHLSSAQGSSNGGVARWHESWSP